jgi:sugar phosphate isomerase/epimerase
MKRNFRIGSTSYVYPGDIMSNVRQLAGVVEDIELVLFEVDDYGTNLPDAAAIAELNALASANDLTFTVHLPLDLRFGDANSFDKARRAIEATRALDPFAFVMHLDGEALIPHPSDPRGGISTSGRALVNRPSPEMIAQWQGDASRALAQIVEWVGTAARVCVENVEAWDPAHFRDLVARAGASRCVDIGHLWLERRDPVPHLVENLARTRVVHLHGIGSRDHQSLRHVPPQELQVVVDTLLRADYAGVVTLEVFGADDFSTSFEVLQDALARSEGR